MTAHINQTMRIPVNGLYLNTKVDGPENAPWLVFSNSLATNLSLWDEQVAALGSQFRILRYDQRGHGHSDMPPAGSTYNDLAQDMLGLLDHFKIEQAIFIGVSMGAVTVLRAAALRPERCRAVIACDGQWVASAAARADRLERIAMAEREDMQTLARHTAARWSLPDFPTRLPEHYRRMEEMVANTPKEGYLGCTRILLDYDFRQDYPGLSMPVLYIAGAQDGGVPKVVQAMAEATPRSTFMTIEHCGHIPALEQPEEFLKAVVAFIATV